MNEDVFLWDIGFCPVALNHRSGVSKCLASDVRSKMRRPSASSSRKPGWQRRIEPRARHAILFPGKWKHRLAQCWPHPSNHTPSLPAHSPGTSGPECRLVQAYRICQQSPIPRPFQSSMCSSPAPPRAMSVIVPCDFLRAFFFLLAANRKNPRSRENARLKWRVFRCSKKKS